VFAGRAASASTSKLSKAEQLAKFKELQDSLRIGSIDEQTLDGIKEAGESAAAPVVMALREATQDRAASELRLLELEQQKFQYQKKQREADRNNEKTLLRMKATERLIEVPSATAVTGNQLSLRLAWTM
jgi:hypothetical protein